MNTAQIQRDAVEQIRADFPELAAGIEFSTLVEELIDSWHAAAIREEEPPFLPGVAARMAGRGACS